MTELSQLTAISPIDGRYKAKTDPIREIFSEYGLIKRRVEVEICWLEMLSDCDDIPEVPEFSDVTKNQLTHIINNFSIEDAQQVKFLEAETNHDVKAVEYFLKKRLTNVLFPETLEFIHFACTSEDINNIAYALMLSDAKVVFLDELEKIQLVLQRMAKTWSNVAMLARTHGQPASPTTLGKEIRVFERRLENLIFALDKIPIFAKINGATGNYSAHTIAYPDVDWHTLSEKFIHSFGLEWNPYTTQIEPHDYMAEMFDVIKRTNTIFIDLCRDMWGYISLGYLKQQVVETETGSSTMPHKVNPIDFENAEGNFGIGNAILEYLSRTLPISRWQRDLTDSTLQRNIGVALAHCLIGYKSLQNGLDKVIPNHDTMLKDLNDNWEVLGEAIQTVMRKHGIENPYEKLKQITRNQKMDSLSIQNFIINLDIPNEAKSRLIKLLPSTYTGKATDLANKK